MPAVSLAHHSKPQAERKRDRGMTPSTSHAIREALTVELDDDELIEAVMGRLDETSGFTATLRALLSMMP